MLLVGCGEKNSSPPNTTLAPTYYAYTSHDAFITVVDGPKDDHQVTIEYWMTRIL